MGAWRIGDPVYQPKKAKQLKMRLDKLINSMRWTPGHKPRVEIGGPVSGERGLAIRNIGAMHSNLFRAFYRAVRRIFLEVMVD